jgi:uncharacterized protein YndB with AHSA1/START domain
MTDRINNVSSDAVKKATGLGWDDWIRFIDGHGGGELDHRGIVALLGRVGGIHSGWWQQMVTVGYEHATGRRIVGETGDAGFQLGVQKVIPLGRGALWELLTSPVGIEAWLGSVAELAFEPGTPYETSHGLVGEIRTVRPGERLRLTWQPADRQAATTLQLTLSCPRNTDHRTTLRFHHEKLAGPAEREDMRAHWKGVLDTLAGLASGR